MPDAAMLSMTGDMRYPREAGVLRRVPFLMPVPVPVPGVETPVVATETRL